MPKKIHEGLQNLHFDTLTLSPSKPNKNKILLLASPTIIGAQFNDGKLDTPLVTL